MKLVERVLNLLERDKGYSRKELERMGAEAFKKGLSRMPSDDPKIVALVKDFKSGPPKKLLVAWTDGWDEASEVA